MDVPFSMVPVPPTKKMLKAGADALTCITPDNMAEAQRCFEAMIKAWEKESRERSS